MIRLCLARETVERSEISEGLEVDLVTHDIKKFFGFMLRENGYVMEQLLSPLVVQTSPEHDELKAIAPACLTKHHAHHYLGFAATQCKLFQKENPPRVKPLLYVYRVLLTGIHLMQSCEIESNLVPINGTAKPPYIPELTARKTGGSEKQRLNSADVEFHEREYQRFSAVLAAAHEKSRLPEAASGVDALHDLLFRIRLKTV
jgi:predicted nucleotidyltransferase